MNITTGLMIIMVIILTQVYLSKKYYKCGLMFIFFKSSQGCL